MKISLRQTSAYAVGFVLYLQRRHDEAITAFRQALEIDPSYSMTYALTALAYAAKGQLAEAIDSAERGASIGAHPYYWIPIKGYVYAIAGRRDYAVRTLGELRK